LAPALALDGHQRLENLAGGGRGVAHRGRIEEQRLRSGDADGCGFVVAGDAEVGEQIRETRGGEVEMAPAVAEVAAERYRYSIHRAGRTSPFAGAAALPRRPSRSVRPASACSKNRCCSRVSPRMTRSIARWRAWSIASTRGCQRPRNACALRMSSVNSSWTSIFPLPAGEEGAGTESGTAPPVSAIAFASQVSCTSSRLM